MAGWNLRSCWSALGGIFFVCWVREPRRGVVTWWRSGESDCVRYWYVAIKVSFFCCVLSPLSSMRCTFASCNVEWTGQNRTDAEVLNMSIEAKRRGFSSEHMRKLFSTDCVWQPMITTLVTRIQKSVLLGRTVDAIEPEVFNVAFNGDSQMLV